jgi:excisionase family DNA binding protein
MEEWLKTKEAAEYLQVHPKTLYRYVKAGKLRQYQPGGVGRPRFKREELDALLQDEEESNHSSERPGFGFGLGLRLTGQGQLPPKGRTDTLIDILQQLEEMSRQAALITAQTDGLKQRIIELLQKEKAAE